MSDWWNVALIVTLPLIPLLATLWLRWLGRKFDEDVAAMSEYDEPHRDAEGML